MRIDPPCGGVIPKRHAQNIGLDKITKKQDKTNDLIIIYLESFEENFLNPNFVSDEVIKNLEFKCTSTTAKRCGFR